jgi:multiple sugar transport system permease protein
MKGKVRSENKHFQVMKNLKNQRTAYLFILPAILCLAFVIAYPFINAILMSFQHYPLLGRDRYFTGLGNYKELLFEDPYFWKVTKNTFVWTFSSIILSFIFSMIVALILNQELKGRRIFRALSILPWAIPPVIASLTWAMFYDPFLGILNIVLKKMGIIRTFHAWLSEEATVLPALIFVVFWKYNAFLIIGLLAGLQGIPLQLYESAKIDGANAVQRFFYITLPQLKPIIFVLLTLQIIWRFNHFDIVWVMTRGGPANSSHLIATYAYQHAFISLDFGYASALGVLGMVFLGIFIVILVQRMK